MMGLGIIALIAINIVDTEDMIPTVFHMMACSFNTTVMVCYLSTTFQRWADPIVNAIPHVLFTYVVTILPSLNFLHNEDFMGRSVVLTLIAVTLALVMVRKYKFLKEEVVHYVLLQSSGTYLLMTALGELKRRKNRLHVEIKLIRL